MIFQIVALAILSTFYGCYFAKMLVQRRKGIRTDHIGAGKTGFVKFVELTMKLATILAPVAELASIALNVSASPIWVRIFGIILSAGGVAAFAASVICMGDSWRAGVPAHGKTALVTSGIYRFSRNPAFLGFYMVYIGILLMFFSWPLMAVSAFAELMFHLQIVNVEEEHLLREFGGEYLAYCQTVRRYIGRKRR